MPKSFGSWLILIGIVVLVVGILANSGMLSWFGRLPGDIRIERENVRFYFPVVTMILISLVLSLIAYFFGKFWK